MSNVHLSGAAALERLTARRALAGPGRSPACRTLFGPVDHEELGRELRSRLREMGEDDQRRWDYNFHTDTPLPGPGRLRWEEVEGGAVPAFYRETLQISSRGGNGRRSPKQRRSAPPAARRPPPARRLSRPPASGSGEPDFCTTAPTGGACRPRRRGEPGPPRPSGRAAAAGAGRSGAGRPPAAHGAVLASDCAMYSALYRDALCLM
ncbi:cyclin-dependent kinase inhibitor 1C isoform X1 [Falco biarmicus]|uniref:cyclin-dependent kinase inhibitor 1C isoform X2 n=1 Tax=Falco rusticolus TaxID=120794 RepID=UPI0018866DD2|nr:cyclin-dependent kinase inhibitor 1C isoform X2 [Falco rusticolus]XP_040465750.1 cyclin-dependent kinase inhibitor 1C isoform X1 [Falco naumanni]XP_055578321.1 cyclin-dependent kinase inhibitor 1C isoform X1 [Falco cherrug]XP_055670063.1 cyclin-dependent kinase inhibitor 1C isoform X1 [Falco peregrinus]XP_056210155.1 cyclin-dependent kinase inhibitor 1C isoform X1 [Falco biarmicus]